MPADYQVHVPCPCSQTDIGVRTAVIPQMTETHHYIALLYIFQVSSIPVGDFHRVDIPDLVCYMLLDHSRNIRQQPYHAYSESSTAYDRIRADNPGKVAAAEFIVGADSRATEITQAAREFLQSVVEFVVPEGGHIIPHRIHQVHLDIPFQDSEIG